MRRDGVGIVPTDTVYGLAASAASRAAVERIYRIKKRPMEKPLPVQVSSIGQAREIVRFEGRLALELIERFWPGPLTLVMERLPGVCLPFQDPESLGLRMPDCPPTLGLIEGAGYLVVPSANISGGAAPASVEDVDPRILEEVDFAIDCGRCPTGVESTVVDVRNGCSVLREGAIAARDVEEVARAAK